MRVVNVPHKDNPRARLASVVIGQSVKIVVEDPQGTPPYNRIGVFDMWLGDNLDHAILRDIVARELVGVIEQARDAGYRQAQKDIIRALGIEQR